MLAKNYYQLIDDLEDAVVNPAHDRWRTVG
jgi:hypothetical protein